MSHCVKTGFMFKMEEKLLTGDLFITEDGLQIRGIPKLEWPWAGGADAAIGVCEFVARPGSSFRDTVPGHVKLLEVSDSFREHANEWHPELLEHFPCA